MTKKSTFYFYKMLYGALTVSLVLIAASPCIAQVRPTADEALVRAKATFGAPPGFTSLSRDRTLWINPDRKMLLCDGFIALRGGQLEMFACPIGTKEHESLIAVFDRPSSVYAGLLAMDVNPGSPVKFEPFTPASGPTVKVYVLWFDADGNKCSTAAQNWIVDVKSKEPMNLDWVFAGSYTVDGRFMGDDGDFITVANFATATLDVAVRSDATNANLMFIPKTDEIPPLFTPVRLVLHVIDQDARK